MPLFRIIEHECNAEILDCEPKSFNLQTIYSAKIGAHYYNLFIVINKKLKCHGYLAVV